MSIFDKLASLKQWQTEQHEKQVKEQLRLREQLVEQNQQLQNHDFKVPEDVQSTGESCSGSELECQEEESLMANTLEESSLNLSDKADQLDRSFITNQDAPVRTENNQPKRIFPFLKRGQGLSRFRMSTNDLQEQKKRIVATKSKSKSPSEVNAKGKPAQNGPKVPREIQTRPLPKPKVEVPLPRKVQVPRAPIPPKLKLAPLKKPMPMEKIPEKVTQQPSKQLVPINVKRDVPMKNKNSWSSILTKPNSDVSPIRKVEQRELRIFERMEQLVDNSSFCSTSSLVARFVEEGYVSSVQSTPISSPSKRGAESPLLLEGPSSQSNAVVENAKALLKELAALKFGPIPEEDEDDEQAKFWENNPHIKNPNAHHTPSESSSSEGEELSQPLELTEEEWEKTGESSESDTSSTLSDRSPPKQKTVVRSTRREVEYASSVSSTDKDDALEDAMAMGSAMVARLEQLQREVEVVQEQQTTLKDQKIQLAREQENLARAIAEAEAQKQRYTGSKLQQLRENQKIAELKSQLEQLQSAWKEKEVRWASAQANQRAQLWQLGQENKKLAQQIKELKVMHGKKVHFENLAKSKPKPALKQPAASSKEVSPEQMENMPEEKKEQRITGAKDLSDALRIYKILGNQDTSLDISQATPRTINQAYFDVFKPRDTSPEKPSVAEMFPEEPAPSIASSRVNALPSWNPPKLSDLKENSRSIPAQNAPRPAMMENTGDVVKTFVHPDGTKQIWYSCGNTLKMSADGTSRRMIFYNGDLQESWSREGVTRYFYSESRVWHETHRDGTQIISYPDGQKELLRPDGSKEVTFPDSSSMCIDADGKQTANLSDGSKLFLNLDGSSILELPNGLREIRTSESTTLQYPDGTVRVKFPSGLLETKYPNGRVRVKDASGKLIMDTHCPVEVD